MVFMELPGARVPLTLTLPIVPDPFRKAPGLTVIEDPVRLPLTESMPPETVVAPVYVLTPAKISFPDPFFVSVPVDVAMAPLP